MYDAIIVGARCAGAPTAMLLARKGYRVLLVDRASFPSDTISTHFIWPPGVARLRKWGLLERLEASGCPPIRNLTFDFGQFALSGSPPMDGAPACYGPRRTVLDKILVDAAVEAGADFRENFSVQEILGDGDRLTGIRSQSHTETARMIIGADGMHSLVARTASAPEYNTRPPLACWYYTYWSGLPADGAELYVRPQRTFVLIPTNDGLVCTPVAWTAREFHAYRADVENNMLRTFDLAPGVAERIRGARRVERFTGTADVPNFFRKPYGPGWALVGDAGYHRDPVTAQGINDAFRDAELLSEAIDAGFSGRQPLEDAMAAYEQRRNESAMAMYELTCQLASLEPPPPPLQQFYAALQGRPEEIQRFLGTFTGAESIPEFYAPENMQRVMSGAQRSASRQI